MIVYTSNLGGITAVQKYSIWWIEWGHLWNGRGGHLQILHREDYTDTYTNIKGFPLPLWIELA